MEKVHIGIDIGGTNTKIGIVAEAKEIIDLTSIPTPQKGSFQEYIESIFSTIDTLFKKHDIPDDRFKGVGIGAPNANYFKGTIDGAPNLIWKETLPVVEMFQKKYGKKIMMINDARAATLGSNCFGKGKEYKNFVFITLGTGLGCGVIENNRLVLGSQSFAGELGHVIIRPYGRTCGCGRKGCLETYVSAVGMKRTIFKLLADYNCDSYFSNIDFQTLDAKMITEASKINDFIALEAFDYTMKIFALKLADVTTLYNPESIILFGGLAKAGEKLLNPLKKYYSQFILNTLKGSSKIEISDLLDRNAAVLGAVALVDNGGVDFG